MTVFSYIYVCIYFQMHIYNTNLYNYKHRYIQITCNTFMSQDPETKHMLNFKAMK